MECELERISREAALIYFKQLFCLLLAGTREYHLMKREPHE
jgi:hypothetical protein